MRHAPCTEYSNIRIPNAKLEHYHRIPKLFSYVYRYRYYTILITSLDPQLPEIKIQELQMSILRVPLFIIVSKSSSGPGPGSQTNVVFRVTYSACAHLLTSYARVQAASWGYYVALLNLRHWQAYTKAYYDPHSDSRHLSISIPIVIAS